MVCRLATDFGWDLDYIFGLTRPQIRLLFRGQREARLIELLAHKHVEELEAGDNDGKNAKSGHGPPARDRKGAYTDRYVRGKGNIMVCPGEPVTEVEHSKERSTLKVQDPRALLSLPPTANGKPVMNVIDRRKKKRKKGKGAPRKK